MQRYKTFEATGIAPNGRLYAGDLNAIQDAAAALTDFTQVVSVASVRFGETGLFISRFGPGEFQMSGDVRAMKIVRALEGLISGAYTTAQRDAIASGRAPYGLAIINTDRNRYEWNRGTDAARDWVPFGVMKTAADLGNGSAKTFRITHNFQTKDVSVDVRETASPYRIVYPEVEIEDLNYVDINFDVAPATNAYRAVVMA